VSATTIRSATARDAASLLEIYTPFVTATAVSFELSPPAVSEFADRIERAVAGWAWLLAERGGRTLGYAYAGPHRARAAYRWSLETSVYIAPGVKGQGVGSALYQALMPRLAERGYCNAYAAITLPNEASIALHQRTGFEPIGTFRRVGRKFGQWHDVSWWHLTLREAPPEGD